MTRPTKLRRPAVCPPSRPRVTRLAVPAGYEFFDHTADLGVRVHAPDLAGLVAPATQALYAAIGELKSRRPGRRRRFELAGSDPAGLLRDFLAELLLIFERDQEILLDPEVRRFDDRTLVVEGRLSPLDPETSILDREVKAITYHGLEVRQDHGQWQATFIVDI